MPEFHRPRGPEARRASPPLTAHRQQHRCPRRGPWPLCLQLPCALSTEGREVLDTEGKRMLGKEWNILHLQLLHDGGLEAHRGAWASSGSSGTGQDGDSDDIACARGSILLAMATMEFYMRAGGRLQGCGHGGWEEALGRDQGS